MRRYPEYKDSSMKWIGEIPEHWMVERAKFIFRRIPRPVRENDEIITAFRDGIVTLRKNRRTLGFTNSLKEIGYQGLRKGDLVIHAMDGHAGAIGVSDSDGKSSPVYSVCRPISQENVYYYAYLLRYMALSGFIESLARGVRERSTEFRFNEFKELELPIPTVSEQTQIANFLDRKTDQIDKLIRIKERQIELLHEQRTALINQAVTKGLDPNVEMKPSGVEWIGEIPAHWEIEKIKYIATFVSAKSAPKTNTIKISPENVESNTGKVLDFYSSYDSIGVKFQVGDVLFNKIRVYLNKVVFAEYDGYSLGEMIVIRPSLQNIGKFLFYLMLSSRFIEYCNSISRGAKMPRTDVYDILNAQIPITSYQEQTQIVNFLDSKTQEMNKLIAAEQRKIELLKEYRQSLISEAVTGKIDVRNGV